MFVEERQDFIVQNIGRRESGFIRVNLGEADVGMSINGRLLIDFADALDVTDIARVLTQQKTCPTNQDHLCFLQINLRQGM